MSLTLQNGILTLQGEKKIEYDQQKENYRMMERSFGSFQRSLRLPDTVDADKVEAQFQNGVLKVSPSVPKPKANCAGSTSRKVSVKQAAPSG